MTKRILALLLVLVMVVALAACGAAKEEPKADESKTEETKKEEPKADDAAEEPADAGEEGPSLSDPYTIVWYYGGTAQPDIDLIQQTMADYVNEKYGMNIALDMVATPYGDLQQKMGMVFASGEKWDLCFTSTWSNIFAQAAANGAYLALEDLLPQYAPELYDYIGDYFKDATMDGHIYAIPNIQVEFSLPFTSIPTKWIEMYNAANPDAKVAPENNYHDVTDLNDFFYWAKENIVDAGVELNGIAPKYTFRESLVAAVDYVGSGLPYIGFETNGTTPLPYWEQSGWALDDIAHKWFNDGLIRSDVVGLQLATADLCNLEYVEYSHPTFKPGEDANQYRYWGLDQSANELTFFTYGQPTCSSGQVSATLTALNAKCERPDIVLNFFNILNNDTELFNIVCFGIEGTHYELKDGIAYPFENSTYNPNNDWGFGNQFLAYPREGQPVDIWEITAQMNESAIVAATTGFQANYDNVATQVANCSAVNEEYASYLSIGARDCSEEEWQAYKQQYIDEMTAAGVDDILAEIQSQVDAWAAANGK